MNRALKFILCSLVLLLGLTTEARACGCLVSFIQYQPCSAYWNANVVFAGTVTEVGPALPVKGSDGKSFSTNGRVTRFRVDDAFRGVSGDMVETVERGTSCDFSFKEGERYFVYGTRDPQDGLIYAHSCSSTKSMQYAAADLEFARAVARGDSLPSLVGVVNRETRQSAASYRAQKPIEGVEVVVEGNGSSLTTKTSPDGRFRFFGLAPGKYRVTARTPPELRNLYGPEFVNVALTEGRCNGAAFTVTSLSTVTGSVVDQSGKPAKIRVSLVSLNEKGEVVGPAEGTVDSYSNLDGVYKFDWVAPGTYRVAINPKSQPGSYDPPYARAYLPGVIDPSQATVITISEGQSYEAPEFRLPAPLAERGVEGMVFLPDGSPVPNALILLEFTERPWSETFSADNQGRFKLKVFAGYKYLVSAEHRKEVAGKWTATHSDPVEVVAGDVTEPLKLIINRAGFYRPVYARQKREVPK
ncbi:MAG: carboxypeptidase regulatory-like domain-containing protein [Pyrinomonadaceae bacterium]